MTKIDPILLLLALMVLFFTVTLIVTAIWFKPESQIITIIASLATGFAGSFFTRIKPTKESQGE